MTNKVISVESGIITVKECSALHPDYVIVAKYFYIKSLEP